MSMKRETAKRLLDARNACLEIEGFTTGKSIDDMWGDRGLQLSLHKLLEIVGEALRQANQSEPEVTATIPNLRLAIDMRNRLTHGYDSVSYSVVWRVAVQDVPALRTVLDDLLKQAPPLKEP